MAGEAEIGELRRGRRWMIASAVGVAGLMGLSIVVVEADDERNHVVLSRSEVAGTARGALVWRGSLTNVAANACRDLAAEIRFLDRTGRMLGDINAHVAGLTAGGRFDLEAALPPGTVDVQLYALRWRTGDASIELGPFRPRRPSRA